MKRLTKETLFKPTRAESKQSVTDNTARAMIEAEADARNKKTERLRKLRMEAETRSDDQAEPDPAKRAGGRGRKQA